MIVRVVFAERSQENCASVEPVSAREDDPSTRAHLPRSLFSTATHTHTHTEEKRDAFSVLIGLLLD